MRLQPAFVLLALFAASGALAQAYTWTDENGVVHYSDRPQPGAKQIALPESTGNRRAAAPASAASASSGNDQDEAAPAQPFRYQTLEVNAPAPEETLWNIEGVLNVSLALSPALQPGHQVRVYFDGNPQSAPGTSFQLDEVYRGVHNIQAEILDEAGQMMIRSLPNRFYVQQTTIARPRR
ncbi:MAG: DUF4124 domain-containing protein [Woeseiaceae bacterium]